METTHNHQGEHATHNHAQGNTAHDGHTHSHTTSSGDGDTNLIMSILAYIGPLVIIPFLVAKDNAHVKFHIKQGLVLLVIEVAVWFLGMILWILLPLLALVNLATLILSVIGIINVVQGKQKELPLVGKYSSYFKM